MRDVHKYLAYQHKQGQAPGTACFLESRMRGWHSAWFVVAQFIAPL